MTEDKFECELMDWVLFGKLTKKLAKKIKQDGFKPDVIVGLARGGWVLARLLCDYIGVKDLVSLKVEHWGITASPDGQAKLKYLFSLDLTGKKVLLVDDITDTGESMRISSEYVKSLNPQELKSAALRHIKGSKIIPDYFAEEISWRWVVFPWNYIEDLCNIVHKVIKKKSSSPSKIKMILKKDFQMDLDEGAIEEILDEIKHRG
jgi:hypoxanthine phosphoribosyltransferase